MHFNRCKLANSSYLIAEACRGRQKGVERVVRRERGRERREREDGEREKGRERKVGDRIYETEH